MPFLCFSNRFGNPVPFDLTTSSRQCVKALNGDTKRTNVRLLRDSTAKLYLNYCNKPEELAAKYVDKYS